MTLFRSFTTPCDGLDNSSTEASPVPEIKNLILSKYKIMSELEEYLA